MSNTPFCLLHLACTVFFTFSLITISCSPQPATTAKSGPGQKPLSASTQGNILKEPPIKPALDANYLFFLHGKIVEDQGFRPTSPQYGVYQYEEILRAFKDNGFVVISEARAKNTDVEQYAAKLVGQITALIKAGVLPPRITVLGASKGAVIAMVASTNLKNKNVNFVLMNNCNDWVDKNFKIDLYGNVLSIYDINDEFGQSCQNFFKKATGLNKRREIKLEIGTGHGILYQPLKEWVDPVTAWARPEGK